MSIDDTADLQRLEQAQAIFKQLLAANSRQDLLPIGHLRRSLILALAMGLAQGRGLSPGLGRALWSDLSLEQAWQAAYEQVQPLLTPCWRHKLAYLARPYQGNVEVLASFFEATLKLEDQRRRQHGIFYTPTFITQVLSELTIEAWQSQGSTHTKMRLLDPACGAGALLLAGLRYYRRSKPQTSLALVPELVGWDSDPEAVELARLVIWLEVGQEKFRPCIEAYDSLHPRSVPAEQFDIVLGNPPHVDNKRLSAATKKELMGSYPTARKLFDLAVPFAERCLDFVRPGGCLGLVLPNKLASADYGVHLRALFLTKAQLVCLVDLAHFQAFKPAAAYPILVVIRKAAPRPQGMVRIYPRLSAAGLGRAVMVEQKILTRLPRMIWDLSGHTMIRWQLQNKRTVPLGEVGRLIYRPFGFTNWKNALEYVDQQHEQGLKFIGCGNVAAFQINWQKALRQGGRRFQQAYLHCTPGQEKSWQLLQRPKILIREIALTLTAAYDRQGEYAYLTGLYGLVDLVPQLDSNFMLVLLNSRLLRFFFTSLFQNTRMGGGYLRFNGSYLKALPIVNRLDLHEQRHIASQALSSLCPDQASRGQAWSLAPEIEELICDLYQIPTNTREIVLHHAI